MGETLEEQLDNLVLQSWGLVYQLYARAELVRKQLLKDSAALLAEHEMLSANALSHEHIKISSKNWYLCIPHGEHSYLSYVHVEIDTTTPRLGGQVYTAFKSGLGLRYADVKQGVSAGVRAKFAEFDDSASHTVVLDVRLTEGDINVANLPARVVAEVERQLPMALALRDYISDRIENSKTGD